MGWWTFTLVILSQIMMFIAGFTIGKYKLFRSRQELREVVLRWLK